MGKVDDMRRRREAEHRARAASAGTEPSPSADAGATGAEDAAEPVEAAADADSGVCSGCGKVKPMQRGLIANHQKGLGKFCVGSRKPPA